MGAIGTLTTQTGGLTKSINAGQEFDYVVVADLANNVSHVDNVLFVFEVAKDGGDITEGDFEITAISLRDDTEGINETFVVEGGKLKGFWGPSKVSSSKVRQQPLQLSSMQKEPIQLTLTPFR